MSLFNMEAHKAFVLYLVFTFVCVGLAGIALGGAPPSHTEIDQYLIVGMTKSANGDAVNVQNTELGANRKVLSNGSAAPNSWAQAGPNTYDVFATRWGHPGPDSSTPPSPAAPIFEGIDWSGNVALTSLTGQFSMSDMDVYADLGVRANGLPAHQSVSNTNLVFRSTIVACGNDARCRRFFVRSLVVAWRVGGVENTYSRFDV